jgi:hypothetical protein
MLLQVKLSASAKFRFLDASHSLHAYYCFLRDENPQPVPPKKTHSGVSLLGAEYDSDVSSQRRVVVVGHMIDLRAGSCNRLTTTIRSTNSASDGITAEEEL